MQKYKTDEAIAEEFQNFTIDAIEYNRHANGELKSSGHITITWPHAGEHVGGGIMEGDTTTDSFIIYDHNGKIAFDNWYPEGVYLTLCDMIRYQRPTTTRQEDHKSIK